MEYTCPVCGYEHLEAPAMDDEICPSCGTHFGYHDYNKSHLQLRNAWIADGAKWWSAEEPPSPYWDAQMQLKNLSHLVNAPKQTATKIVQKIDDSETYGFVARWRQSWNQVKCYNA